MFRKIMAAAVLCVLFSPALFSEMPSGGGLGGQGTGSGSLQGPGRQAKSNNQGTKQNAAAPVKTDNVNDILTFEDKLDLTSQQVVTMRMISADAQLEESDQARAVLVCQQEFEKGLGQVNPDFTYIHKMLNELTQAQAKALAVPVNAYEKAYALLTDSQKANLAFLLAARRDEMEKKAAAETAH